jgi:hypothetical protein
MTSSYHKDCTKIESNLQICTQAVKAEKYQSAIRDLIFCAEARKHRVPQLWKVSTRNIYQNKKPREKSKINRKEKLGCSAIF